MMKRQQQVEFFADIFSGTGPVPDWTRQGRGQLMPGAGPASIAAAGKRTCTPSVATRLRLPKEPPPTCSRPGAVIVMHRSSSPPPLLSLPPWRLGARGPRTLAGRHATLGWGRKGSGGATLKEVGWAEGWVGYALPKISEARRMPRLAMVVTRVRGGGCVMILLLLLCSRQAAASSAQGTGRCPPPPLTVGGRVRSERSIEPIRPACSGGGAGHCARGEGGNPRMGRDVKSSLFYWQGSAVQ
ncbi:hypothetical protein B0T11DRAFT_143139 [Plectosphaerella cucumerina]|uniref:Uncharacterized protein n=1 Tax=Plectosphaerella cucumerina TaxID=40658 RepID=A0A8K0TAG9_9PEZI|nr:hypothetical protein B0T11DRAFT_143139 [Plectosphaerella cucumerina]